MEDTAPVSADLGKKSFLPDLIEKEELRMSMDSASAHTSHLPGLGQWTAPSGSGIASTDQDALEEKKVAVSDGIAIPELPEELHAVTEAALKPVPEAKINEGVEEHRAEGHCAIDDGAARADGEGVMTSQEDDGIHRLGVQDEKRAEVKKHMELFSSSTVDSNASSDDPAIASSSSATVSADREASASPGPSNFPPTSASPCPPDLPVASASPGPTGLPPAFASPTSPDLPPASATATVSANAETQSQIELADPCLNGGLLPHALSSTGELPDAEKDVDRPMPDVPEAEFEVDSSPYASSSEDSSDTSDDDDDYVMLDAAEQARLLMEGDGGSDDEGARKGPGAHQLRTTNERPDEVVEVPNVLITADTEIEELGHVENTIDNVTLISAKTSGEYRVLETGSVLCLEDRKIIGVVSETLGRVEQPFYSVRFPNPSAIAEASITKNTRIYYIPQHSTFVFTKALQAVKGSDASNLHDEEVAADELDFSDDEAETEYKREKKAKKHGRPPGHASELGFSRRPRGGHSSDRRPPSTSSGTNVVTNLQYDDRGDEELYTPLSRPPDLYSGIAGTAPGTTPGTPGAISGTGPPERSFSRHNNNPRGRGNRGGHTSERGRPQRGRGAVYNPGHDIRRESNTMGRPCPPPQLNISMPHAPSAPSPSMSSPSYFGSASTPGYGGFPAASPPTTPFHPQQPFGQTHMAYPTASYPTSPATPMGFQPPYLSAQQAVYHSPQQAYFPAPHPPHGHAPAPSYGHAAFPPGAFVNPAFLNGGQQQAYAAPHQHGPVPASAYSPTGPPGLAYSNPAPGQGTAAFQAAQERLDVLKRL